MLKLIAKSAVAAAGALLVMGAAVAAERHEQSPESRLYMALSFGGERIVPRNLHYGLRVDRDSRFHDEAALAPLMLIDFTSRGLADARVNGLSVLKAEYRLRQTEEGAPAEAVEEVPAEAPAEEAPPAEPAPAEAAPADTAAAPAEEAPAEAAAEAGVEEVATEGFFLGYNAIDWVLLAAGLGGVGLAVSDVANSEEDASRKDSDGDGVPDDEEPPAPCTPQPFCDILFTARAGAWQGTRDVAYEEWLDSGTGQMGDLGD